jgi:hypothetical protein
MLGYAAMLHGVIFVVAMMSYSHIVVISDRLTFFITPFGMIFTLAMLQTLLYWGVLIGLINSTVRVMTNELSHGTWRLLRLTPYSIPEILLTKLMVVIRPWFKSMRTLMWIRLILLGIALTVQLLPNAGRVSTDAQVETASTLSIDIPLAAVFILEPFIEAVLVMMTSTFSAFLTRQPVWARVGAYGLNALILGGLSFISSLWLMFTTAAGPLSALLVPLNHWGPLVAAVMPADSQADATLRVALFVVMYVIAPVTVAIVAFRAAIHLGQQIE